MPSCIFCDGNANSLEHAWPEWCLEDTGGAKRYVAWTEQGKKTREWETHTPEITVKTVCGDCNEGWMSKLEDAAKPIMKEMMMDIGIPINRPQRGILTQWSVKTAMVFESSDRDRQSFYSHEERHNLKHGILPSEVVIWLGRYNGDHRSHFSRWTVLNSDNAIKCHLCTLSIGRLIIQIMCIKAPPQFKRPIIFTSRPGNWEERLVQIFPADKYLFVRWPPRLSFSDPAFSVSSLEALAYRFDPIE